MNRSSRASASPSSTGSAVGGGAAIPGGSPVPDAVKTSRSNSSAAAALRARPPGATRTRNANRSVAGM